MTFERDKLGSIETKLIGNYFESLKGQFFKILPMTENHEPTRIVHIRSFQSELMGLDALLEFLNEDARFMSLLAVLEYLADNPELDVKTVRREVFKACSICNLLAEHYAEASKEVRK